MAEITPGTLIRGKYKVERVLGEGGMGMVLAAWHEALDQRVAIKVLRPELLGDDTLRERFRREAQAASRIRSDHVARVIDVDVLDDGVPFMVMEYLDGRDLGDLRGSPLSHTTAVEYVPQTCDAIAEAHAIGIIHRDIKPANLFLTRTREGRPLVKVLDFGISKIEKSEHGQPASVTRTTTVMGSVVYMSPEQMLSARDVDGRTDIWALGVTLYELCTGELPFPGETVPQVCALVMHGPPPPPRTLRPELPEGLEAVILRCLARQREDRYATIADLCDALAPFAGDRDPTEVTKLAHALRRGSASAPLLIEAPRARVDGQSATVPASSEAIASLLDAADAPERASAAPRGAESVTSPDVVTATADAATPPARGRSLLLVAGLGVAAVIALAAAFLRGPAPQPAAAGVVTSATPLPATTSAIAASANAPAPAVAPTPSVSPAPEAKPTAAPAASTAEPSTARPAPKPALPNKPRPAKPSTPTGPSIY
jgi:serine/threonine-protein kinase